MKPIAKSTSRRWLWLAGGFVAVVLILAFYATDEPVRHQPVPVEKLAPSFPGSVASHQVILRFWQVSPPAYGLPVRRMLQGLGPDQSVNAADQAKFQRFLLAHRPEIEADWNDLGMLQTWWMDMAAFARLGDESRQRPDDPVPPYQPFRIYVETAVAVAGLQALDGQGDAAFATLQPAIEVARRLEPSSRSLLRLVTSRNLQGKIIDGAAYILATTAVSPEAMARFAAALAEGSGGEEGARRIIAVESAAKASLLVAGDPFEYGPQLFFATLVSPHRTLNAFLEWSAQMQDLAARREGAKMDAFTQAWREQQASYLHNLAGSAFLHQATGQGYGKLIGTYWETEDKREALLKRLRPPAEPGRPESRAKEPGGE